MVRNAVARQKHWALMLALVTCSPLTCLLSGRRNVRRDGKIRHPRRGMEAAGIYGVAAEFGAKALTTAPCLTTSALTSRPLPLSVRHLQRHDQNRAGIRSAGR